MSGHKQQHRAGIIANLWAAAVTQLRPTQGGRRRTHTAAAFRHISRTRALVAVLGLSLAVALLAPLLLLTSLTPGSPKHLVHDPAVRALLDYQAGQDGSPEGVRRAREAARTLLVTTLPDGSTKAARVSPTGQCYYLLLPASADLPSSGVRAGTDNDCR